MGLLSLAVTNLLKVGLWFKYLKVNQNEMLVQISILKIEQYYNKVCFHTSEQNKYSNQCIYPVNVNSKFFNAKPLLVELDVTRGR